MTSTEPTEVEEMSGRVLEIIDAYRMGAAVDPRDLFLKSVPKAGPEPVRVAGEGYIRDGVYHVADPVRSRRDGEIEIESCRRPPERRAMAA
jgi:hypothetical protein